MRLPALLLAAALAVLACPTVAAATQPLPQSPDAGLWTPNGSVTSIATAGGVTYVGGTFSYVGPPTGAAISVDSAAKATPIGPVTGSVKASVADAAGGAYLAGSMTLDDGTHAELLHVLADGSIDPDFDAPRFTNGVYGMRALALSGTTLYVGGDFKSVGGASRTGLAALDAGDGHVLPFKVDLTALSGEPRVDALAVVGGNLYAGGAFYQAAGVTCKNLIHVKPDGQLFTGICNWSPDGTVRALAVQDSILYVGGSYNGLGSSAGRNLRRFGTASDLPDTLWLPVPDHEVRALAATASTVYLGGTFTTVGSGAKLAARQRAAAVSTADGTPLGWKPAPSGTLWAPGTSSVDSLLVAGGSVYVGGEFTSIGGHARNNVAALDLADGTAVAWNPNVGGAVYALAATTGGRIVAGGYFNAVGGVRRQALAALGPDGSATAWNPGADHAVTALATSPDGATVYVAGHFTEVGGAPRSRLAAISAASGNATGFDPGPNGNVADLSISPDGGTLYAAGNFTTIGQSSGADRPNLAALSTTTGDPSGWRPAPDGGVIDISRSPDGALLYAVGYFGHIGSQPSQPARTGAAAVTIAGGAATDWEVEIAGGWVGAVLPTASRIFLGGAFTTVAGEPRKGVAATDALGALAPWTPAFGPGSTGNAIARDASGNTLVGGSFWTGSAWRSVVETDAATGTPTAWNPVLGGGVVYDLAVDGRRLWVGGEIEAAGGRAGLVRFTRPADPAAPGGGTGTPTTPVPPPAADTTAPALSNVGLRRTRFRTARRATALSARVPAGTTLRYTLSEPARVRVVVQRRRAGRFVRLAVLRRDGLAGRNRVAFTGRLGKRALRPGRYRLRVSAADAAGNASRPVRLGFRIVRG